MINTNTYACMCATKNWQILFYKTIMWYKRSFFQKGFLLTSFLLVTVVLWLVGWCPWMIFSTFNLWPKSAKLCSFSKSFLFSGDWGMWVRLGEDTARRYCGGRNKECGQCLTKLHFLKIEQAFPFKNFLYLAKTTILTKIFRKIVCTCTYLMLKHEQLKKI